MQHTVRRSGLSIEAWSRRCIVALVDEEADAHVLTGSGRALGRSLARALAAAPSWTPAALAGEVRRIAPGADGAWTEALVLRIHERFGLDPRPRPLMGVLTGFVRSALSDPYGDRAREDAGSGDDDDEDFEDLDDLERLADPRAADLDRAPPLHDPAAITAFSMLPARGAPETWRVPALASLGDLARWLGIGDADLDTLADAQRTSRRVGLGPLRHYAVEARPKPGGGLRVLERPKPLLKRVQRRVLHGLLAHVPPHPAAHGFVRGRSALTHARLHAGQPVVLRFDLRDFFATVHAGRVLAIFRTAGYPEPVARALLGLTTHGLSRRALRALGLDAWSPLGQHLQRGHLPQGAPTSPALANLAALRLDRRLQGLARALGATYSRYADDLVLSGSAQLARRRAGIEARVGTIALESGFELQHAKTRCATASTRQVVGGWVVNAQPAVARDDYDRLRAVLHDAALHGPGAANRAGHPRFAAHLQGAIARVAEASPSRAAKLRALAARIPWDPEPEP